MCTGEKTKQALDELNVYIERGTPDGHEERFRDAADEFIDTRAGAVVFKIQQLPHKTFTRDVDNLKTNVEITLKQALLGFEMEIEHLDGHKVLLSKKSGQITQPGEVQKIEDEGMPKYGMPSDAGDLYVTYIVRNPLKLDAGQKTLIK